MPNQDATPRIARTIAIHTLLSFAAGVVAPLANHLLSWGREYGMVNQVAWFALFNAQTTLLQIYAAFGAAALPRRLPVFAVGVALGIGGGLWWYWWSHFLSRATGQSSYDPEGLLWGLAYLMTIHLGLSSVAVLCLRPYVGVIRQATPLVTGGGKRLSLWGLFTLTTAVALAAGVVRLLAVANLLSSLTQMATIVGLTVVAFSEKRRWAGVLLWIGAVTLGRSLHVLYAYYYSHDLGWTKTLSILLEIGSTGVLASAITYATLWPLRRAGYRLTCP